MINARLPQQGVNYKPTGRRIAGEGGPKQNGGTKFIFRDSTSLNGINLRRARKRRNYSFLPINHFSVHFVVILTHSSIQDKIFLHLQLACEEPVLAGAIPGVPFLLPWCILLYLPFFPD